LRYEKIGSVNNCAKNNKKYLLKINAACISWLKTYKVIAYIPLLNQMFDEKNKTVKVKRGIFMLRTILVNNLYIV